MPFMNFFEGNFKYMLWIDPKTRGNWILNTHNKNVYWNYFSKSAFAPIDMTKQTTGTIRYNRLIKMAVFFLSIFNNLNIQNWYFIQLHPTSEQRESRENFVICILMITNKYCIFAEVSYEHMNIYRHDFIFILWWK